MSVVIIRTLLGSAAVLAVGSVVLRQPWPFVVESRSFLSFVSTEERQLEESSSRRMQAIAPAPEDLRVDASPTGLWQLRAIRAQEAWAALDLRWSGRTSERPRIRVGVYDGAMATAHPDLAQNLEDDDPSEALATGFAWSLGLAHGVGMMGIIGGAGAPGMIGAAPRSIMIPFHTLRAGRDTSLPAALSYFHAHAVRIANFAIAAAEPLGPAAAVREAAEAGTLVVTGLPNRNAESLSYPAAYPGVVTASGVDNQDEPAGFGWGDLVDVVAPGWGMPTTAAVLRFGTLGWGAPYGHQCCNSVASALTTGAAALILESDPSLTSAQIEKRIKLSARKTAGMRDAHGRPVRWHPRFGYGVL
ncbi:MAG: S8 family serine peptidase, partial [Chloroflexota bacterium]